MNEKKVTNCQDCPFCNYDNEFGHDKCNLDSDIQAEPFEELPSLEVHHNCPLREESVTIKL